MPTFVITWKPLSENEDRGWPLEKLLNLVDQVEAHGYADEPWRFQAHKMAQIGDRVFLLRQGQHRKGVIGYGRIHAAPFRDSDKKWYAPVRFEHLVNPDEQILIPHAKLLTLSDEVRLWDRQASGTSIPTAVAAALENLINKESSANPDPKPGGDWSGNEVRIIINDYFDMLLSESKGIPYNKTEHRNALQKTLPARSSGSIERKHQNISAILVAEGLPYIPGYKPLPNAQALLRSGVQAFINENRTRIYEILDGFDTVPENKPTIKDPAQVFMAPPQPSDEKLTDSPGSTKKGTFIDYAARDQANRALGLRGESFVVDLERRRLFDAKREDLADQVEHIAQTQGDGIGYDVRSFDPQSSAELHIEVKTTNSGPSASFYLTANEIEYGKNHPAQFRIYRIYNFKADPCIFVIHGDPSAGLKLEPTLFRASLKSVKR